MKLTKYRHACVVLEEQGKKIIIDPGCFSPEFGGTDNIVAVVVTHVHHDHFDAGHLAGIAAANPEVEVFTTPEAAQVWNNPHAKAVKAGDEQKIGPFTLRFYGELHKAVHPDWPQAQNIGVLVNGRFYYPGDSLTVPDHEVELLAAPAALAWLKMGETIDFIKTIKPHTFIRTHDNPLSKDGISTVDKWFREASKKYGPEYKLLNPGDSIEF